MPRVAHGTRNLGLVENNSVCLAAVAAFHIMHFFHVAFDLYFAVGDLVCFGDHPHHRTIFSREEMEGWVDTLVLQEEFNQEGFDSTESLFVASGCD
jgi:hypothetical protein